MPRRHPCQPYRPGGPQRNCLGVLVAAALTLGACAFQADPAPVAAVNVFQSYDNKVPGRWLLVVDGAAFAKPVKPIGLACSAHTYPVNASGAFRASVLRALQNVMDSVEMVESAPTGAALGPRGYAGIIRVTADTMNVNLSFQPGVWTASATASVETVANLAVDGPRGRIFGTSAEGVGSGNVGEVGCPGGSEAVAQGTQAAMRRLVTALAERVANAPRIREAAPKRR